MSSPRTSFTTTKRIISRSCPQEKHGHGVKSDLILLYAEIHFIGSVDFVRLIFQQIGVAPFGNANCIAQSTGIYLSFYREMEGPGARVPFMGSEPGWTLLSTDSNQDLIAQLCIFASLQQKDKVHGRTFNVGDNSIPLSWSTRWPLLAAYFGLEGTGPSKDCLTPAQYIDNHWNEFQILCHERGLREDVVYRSIRNTGSKGKTSVMDFDRHLDLGRARALGFDEELSSKDSWYTAFDRLRKAKLLF